MFGWNYQNLYDGSAGKSYAQVIVDIDELFQFLEREGLRVTNQACAWNLVPLRARFKTAKPDAVITDTDSKQLADSVKSIDKTLDSELSLREAYILTEKRLNLNKLLNDIGGLFAEKTFSKLPQGIQVDLSEAGKCIAFERPTAAAFHVLRGTEGILRLYYYGIVRRRRTSNPMWASMIDELRKRKRTPGPLLDSLDHIRLNFRNPTAHPGSIYTLDEAQDLFGVCIDAINRLVKELDRLGIPSSPKP
jgi:hypothetical protein